MAKKNGHDATDISDLIGKPPRARQQKNGMTYTPLDSSKPVEGGIFERRAEKGQNLGRTCLICNEKLTYRGGRPPILCDKKTCFRTYRNRYRKDYDAQHPAAR